MDADDDSAADLNAPAINAALCALWPTPITLVVEEIDNGGRYDAHVDGRYLLTSPQPFLDGARALLEQGYDPTRRLEMRRAGRNQFDLAAPLGKAAGLRVKVSTQGTPIFGRHSEARETRSGAPPMRQNEVAATSP